MSWAFSSNTFSCSPLATATTPTSLLGHRQRESVRAAAAASAGVLRCHADVLTRAESREICNNSELTQKFLVVPANFADERGAAVPQAASRRPHCYAGFGRANLLGTVDTGVWGLSNSQGVPPFPYSLRCM
jgi:hypothetical protein